MFQHQSRVFSFSEFVFCCANKLVLDFKVDNFLPSESLIYLWVWVCSQNTWSSSTIVSYGENLGLIWFSFIKFFSGSGCGQVKTGCTAIWGEQSQNFSAQCVYEQTLHHFIASSMPVWNGLKAWRDGFEKQKQINRGDPGKILLWYLRLSDWKCSHQSSSDM